MNDGVKVTKIIFYISKHSFTFLKTNLTFIQSTLSYFWALRIFE